MSVNIYEYLDYREYIKDAFSFLRAKNPELSMRAFARQCNSTSPNFLQLLLSRKLNLSVSTLHGLAKALGLKRNEEEYLDSLVSFDRAKTFEARDRWYQRVLQLRTGRCDQVVEKLQYAYYSNWHHSAIRALLGYHKFNPSRDSYQALAGLLDPPISARSAKKSVRLLEELGLITLNLDNVYEQTSPVVTTGPLQRTVQVAKFQVETIQLAMEALNKPGPENREISTLTLNISEDAYHRIREKIILSRKEIIEIARSSQKDDRVYQLNFQFFPLTKLKKKRSRRKRGA